MIRINLKMLLPFGWGIRCADREAFYRYMQLCMTHFMRKAVYLLLTGLFLAFSHILPVLGVLIMAFALLRLFYLSVFYQYIGDKIGNPYIE